MFSDFVCECYAHQAAARHQCSYLVNIHSTEFLLQHGDEQWLKGVQHAPAKLQRLNEVNRILAHRPWLITTDHIQVNSFVFNLCRVSDVNPIHVTVISGRG